MAEEYRFCLEDDPSQTDIETLTQSLIGYNDSQAEPENWQPLAIFIRDNREEMLGGIEGYTHWGWLFIHRLWVAEHLRRHGYGSQLMHRLEQEAVRRSCFHAHVDTYSFQARGFYEKLGYRLFGVLEDYPSGHTRFFLQKRNLDKSA